MNNESESDLAAGQAQLVASGWASRPSPVSLPRQNWQIAIAIVDGDPERGTMLGEELRFEGFHARSFTELSSVLASDEYRLPDVVIMTLSLLPSALVADEVRRIRAALGSPCLIVSVEDGPLTARTAEAMRGGARAAVIANFATDNLVQIIRDELKRPIRCVSLPDGSFRLGFATSVGLTARQKQVIEATANGLSNKQTAHLLQLNPRTVEAHRTSALRKLGVKSTIELLRLLIP